MAKNENDPKKAAAMAMSAEVVDQVKKEFEKDGTFQFNPKLQENLTRFLANKLHHVLAKNPSPSCSSGRVARYTRPRSPPPAPFLPPLVLHFDNDNPDGNDSTILMAILKEEQPELLINSDGTSVTPALVSFIPGKGLTHGNESKEYSGPSQVWRAINFRAPFSPKEATQTVNLKKLGLYDLPRLFFIGYLLRKLRISVELSEKVSSKVAILSLPIQIKSGQRQRLKEAAFFAGFEEVYCVTAEGLAAYNWFAENWIRVDLYWMEYVIIDLYGHVVLYKVVEYNYKHVDDFNRMPFVEAVVLLDLYPEGGEDKEKDDFREKVKQILGTPQTIFNGTERVVAPIPIVKRKGEISWALHLAEECGIKAAFVEENDCENYAVMGGARLSEDLGNFRSHIRNMSGWIIKMGGVDKVVIEPERMLPIRLEKGEFKIKHVRAKYAVTQVGIGSGDEDEELLGYLGISGVEYGKRLKITFDISWEGIWRVRKVCKCRCDNVTCCEAPVKWAWRVADDQRDYSDFGAISYGDGYELLGKVVPSSSQGQSEGQAKVGNLGGRSSGEGTVNYGREPKVRKMN